MERTGDKKREEAAHGWRTFERTHNATSLQRRMRAISNSNSRDAAWRQTPTAPNSNSCKTIMASVGVENLKSNSWTVQRRLTTCWVYPRARLCASLSVLLALSARLFPSLALSITFYAEVRRTVSRERSRGKPRARFLRGKRIPVAHRHVITRRIFSHVPVSCNARRTAIGTIRRPRAAIVPLTTCLFPLF